MAHRLDEFAEKLFGNRWVYLNRNTIYLYLDSRVIRANWAICPNRTNFRFCYFYRMVRFWESRDRERDDIWKSLADNLFFEKMFPVVIGVKRKIILLTSLAHSKAAGFLISKSDGPFLKMNLMKFLSCIHEIILLDKMKANCMKLC